MRHIHIKTEDLREAIAYAGVYQSAKEQYGKINQPFTMSFERTTPEISLLADCFPNAPKDAVPYLLPNEEQCEMLDHYSAFNQQKELEEQHGIMQEMILQKMNLPGIASNALLYTHGIISKPGYYYPKVKVGREFDYNLVVQKEEHLELGIKFLEARGITDIRAGVAEREDFGRLNAIHAINSTSCKAYVGEPTDPMLYVLRAYYKGCDHIQESIPVIAVVPENLEPTDRMVCSWAAHVPIFHDDTEEVIARKFKAWVTRSNFNFDFFAYNKAMAAERKKVIQ